MKYREAIAQTTLEMMEADPKIIILGAGVADPKGIFGTTTLARERFPDRVIETPLSENMLTGALAGLASNGWKPIYVHARAEFSLLGMEHIVNTIAKWPWLHGGQTLPIVIRMLVGRGWGQGPTHSQGFHGMFASVPGLMVRYPVRPQTVGAHLRHAIERDYPTIFIEPRRMYEMEWFDAPDYLNDNKRFDARIITIGDCVLDALTAARTLYPDANIWVDPYEDFSKPIHAVSMPTLIVDSMPSHFGAATVLMGQLSRLGHHHVRVLGAQFTPCPTSEGLERYWYPTTAQIIAELSEMLWRFRPSEGLTVQWKGRDGKKEPF